eukprot:366272-Chlamydomonas_euryale.AAC.1
MRSLTPGVPPPIIMISGKASTKDVIKGLQAGSCDYISKPFQPQEVLARVETQLRLFLGEVSQLQEAAERNVLLLSQGGGGGSSSGGTAPLAATAAACTPMRDE